MRIRYITEQSNLILDTLIERMLAATYDNVRLDTHSLQLFYTGLGRLGFHFLRSTQIRNQSYMNQNSIFSADFMLELTNRLQERLAFDITDCTTDFNDCNTHIRVCEIAVETTLDFIRNVWNDLNGTSAIIAAALLL